MHRQKFQVAYGAGRLFGRYILQTPKKYEVSRTLNNTSGNLENISKSGIELKVDSNSLGIIQKSFTTQSSSSIKATSTTENKDTTKNIFGTNTGEKEKSPYSTKSKWSRYKFSPKSSKEKKSRENKKPRGKYCSSKHKGDGDLKGKSVDKEKSPCALQSCPPKEDKKSFAPKEEAGHQKNDNKFLSSTKKEKIEETVEEKLPCPSKDQKGKPPYPPKGQKEKSKCPPEEQKEKSPFPSKENKEKSPRLPKDKELSFCPSKDDKPQPPCPLKKEQPKSSFPPKPQKDKLPCTPKQQKENPPGPQKVKIKENSSCLPKETKEKLPSSPKEQKEKSLCSPKEKKEKSSCSPKKQKEKSSCPSEENKEKPLCPPKEPKEKSICPDKEQKEKLLDPSKENKEKPLCPPKETKEKSICPDKEQKEKSLDPSKENKEKPLCPPKEQKEKSLCPPKEEKEKSPCSFTKHKTKSVDHPKEQKKEKSPCSLKEKKEKSPCPPKEQTEKEKLEYPSNEQTKSPCFTKETVNSPCMSAQDSVQKKTSLTEGEMQATAMKEQKATCMRDEAKYALPIEKEKKKKKKKKCQVMVVPCKLKDEISKPKKPAINEEKPTKCNQIIEKTGETKDNKKSEDGSFCKPTDIEPQSLKHKTLTCLSKEDSKPKCPPPYKEEVPGLQKTEESAILSKKEDKENLISSLKTEHNTKSPCPPKTEVKLSLSNSVRTEEKAITPCPHKIENKTEKLPCLEKKEAKPKSPTAMLENGEKEPPIHLKREGKLIGPPSADQKTAFAQNEQFESQHEKLPCLLKEKTKEKGTSHSLPSNQGSKLKCTSITTPKDAVIEHKEKELQNKAPHLANNQADSKSKCLPPPQQTGQGELLKEKSSKECGEKKIIDGPGKIKNTDFKKLCGKSKAKDAINKMDAILYDPIRKELQFNQVAIPTYIKKTEVVVQITCAGASLNDLKLAELATEKCIVPGREFTGMVCAVGSDVHHVKAGDQVVVAPCVHGAMCQFCSKEALDSCVKENESTALGVYRNGAWAEFCVAPCNIVYKTDAEPEQACLLPSLAQVMCIMSRLNIARCEQVVILGAGLTGSIWAILLSQSGHERVLICEDNPNKVKHLQALETNYEVIGVEHMEKQESTLVISCGASADAIQRALNTLQPHGQLILCGPSNGMGNPLVISAPASRIINRQLSIKGTIGTPSTPTGIEASVLSKLKPEKLGVLVCPLENFKDSLNQLTVGDVNHVIFQMRGNSCKSVKEK